MLFQYLLSGHMFPIDMLADIPTGLAGVSLADIVRLLPFEYTAYFPAAVWLGNDYGVGARERHSRRNCLARHHDRSLSFCVVARYKTI